MGRPLPQSLWCSPSGPLVTASRADEASPPLPFQPLVCRPHGSGCDHGCAASSGPKCHRPFRLGPLPITRRPRHAVYVPSSRYPGRAVRVNPSFQSWKVAPTWDDNRRVGVGTVHQGGFTTRGACLACLGRSLINIIIEALQLVPAIFHLSPPPRRSRGSWSGRFGLTS